MVGLGIIKKAIPRETLSTVRFKLVLLRIVVGVIPFLAFLVLDIIEAKEGFVCDWTGNIRNINFIQGECYHKYKKENYKRNFAPYFFILVNVLLVLMVSIIFSQRAKSTVNELNCSPEDAEGKPRNRRQIFFIAYLFHLVVCFVLEIIFIVLLETQSFYPSNFPSDFNCSVKDPFYNQTQYSNCLSHQAGDKNVWTKLVTAVNGFFAFSAFLEIVWIFLRARNGKKFMENWQFYAVHLKSNSDKLHQAQSEEIPLVEPLHQAQPLRDFQGAIHKLKENCLQGTEQPSDLKQPFQRPNPDKGNSHHLTMDNTDVHVAIHEFGAPQQFVKDLDRLKQLEEYPPDEKDCQFTKPDDIIDMEHKNVLVIGLPGVGKTSWSTRMLRLWASGKAFKAFNVVFLMKFRRFNDHAMLSLRELLARAETVQRLDDSVWHVIKTESTKVLLIFDGVDKYSRKEDIKAQKDDSTYKNDAEEKMPLSVLYTKLAAGELLRGASIITMTRPIAVKYVAHVSYQRTVEIRGFTSKNVEDCVEKFTQGVPGAKEKMWGHIKSNIYIFSFCYIPRNCFLICRSLLQMILYESSQVLPTTITDIYKMAINMFFFSHNREGCSLKELEKLKSTPMYKPFELQEMLNSLEKIAFKGIEEGRLFFESSEVCGLEDCRLLHKLPYEQPPGLSDMEPKSQFCFAHLMVQEFFAAKYLVDTLSKEQIERFVHNHINVGTWQVVLLFLAGLLKSSSSDIFMKLLPKSTEKKENFLSSEGEKLIFWPKKDKNLALKVCKYLYEITDVQQPELQNKILKINLNAVDLSNCSLTPIDLVALLHFLENAEKVLCIKLCSSKLGDVSAKYVNKFIIKRKCKCKLKCLNLSENMFTDNALKDLADALKRSNCGLERLNLSDNKLKLTEEGRQCLINAGEESDCKIIF